jgi:4-alpha-glucanotransferase
MTLIIRLRYHARFGQTLFLCGEHPLLGNSRQENAVPLHYINEEFWEAQIAVPNKPKPKGVLSYYFFVRNEDGSVVEDFGGDRKLEISDLPAGRTLVLDSWNDVNAIGNVYFTEPFKKVLLRAEKDASVSGAGHQFTVKAPLLPKGQTICLLGSDKALGKWSLDAPVLLRREEGCFRAEVDLSRAAFPVVYKYGIFDTETNTFVQYEDGVNRVLTEPVPADGRVLVNDGFARVPSPPWRGAGVAMPVFGLRSAKSFGVGEFLDLPLLADWAQRAGLKLIQILPVNDTDATGTWTDSYPYAGISAFALHPLYLNLDRLGNTKSIARQREELNALDTVDYEAVMKAKLGFVRKVFPKLRKKTMASVDYKTFFAQNEKWLMPYAAFCVLRDNYKTTDFTQWPEHRTYNAKKIRALDGDELDFHCFIQFHLHLQLREAADYIHAHGLVLKGDVAIGVHPHSAEVWQQPELFHTHMQAGAPPDAFAAKGQNWGFPTYNWDRMKEDGYDWWKRRFAQMSRYFDAFRIDHILGFFRIWSIPREAVEGILGHFVPALPVNVGEFAARGIAFDKERFTRPFINDAVLREVFGDRADSVKSKYLKGGPGGTYLLKPQFSTQRGVENEKEPGLFDLISNVLLFEEPGSAGKEYHFRLGMEQTPSFRQLDPNTQGRLRDLYIDYYFRRQDSFWMREGMQKLPAMKRVTNMLICGEDLGMVPDCVPVVMKQLGLLSLEIQRMPKALGQEFSRPADAPYLSVVTPATHDMSTIRGWWLEDKNLTQKFFNQELRLPGAAPAACEPGINREVVRQHLDSPAMWSIFQLQDLLGMDGGLRRAEVEAERINVPAIPKYYWRYRMHLPLEKLARAENFTRSVENMVRQSGR